MASDAENENEERLENLNAHLAGAAMHLFGLSSSEAVAAVEVVEKKIAMQRTAKREDDERAYNQKFWTELAFLVEKDAIEKREEILRRLSQMKFDQKWSDILQQVDLVTSLNKGVARKGPVTPLTLAQLADEEKARLERIKNLNSEAAAKIDKDMAEGLSSALDWYEAEFWVDEELAKHFLKPSGSRQVITPESESQRIATLQGSNQSIERMAQVARLKSPRYHQREYRMASNISAMSSDLNLADNLEREYANADAETIFSLTDPRYGLDLDLQDTGSIQQAIEDLYGTAYVEPETLLSDEEQAGLATIRRLTAEQVEKEAQRIEDEEEAAHEKRVIAIHESTKQAREISLLIPGASVFDFNFINLNSLLSEDLLQDKVSLLDKNFKLSRLEDDALGFELIKPFAEYYSSKMQSIEKLFLYLDQSLKGDMERGKQVYTFGNDFKRDLRQLKEVPDQILKALQENNSDVSDIIESRFESKYQATIVTDKQFNFKGVIIFSYDGGISKKTGKASPQFIANLFLKPELFSDDSPLKTGNCLRYLNKFSVLEMAAKESFNVSANLMGAQSASKAFFGKEEYSECLNPNSWMANLPAGLAALTSNSYTDYIKFSKQFQRPNIMNAPGTEIEKKEKRANETKTDVSAFSKVVKGTVDAAQETAIDFMANDYIVSPKDSMIKYLSIDDAGEKEYLGLGKPKEAEWIIAGGHGTPQLSERSLKEREKISPGFAEREENRKDSPLAILSRDYSFTGEGLLGLNKGLEATFKESYDKYGNALTLLEGKVIKVPKAGLGSSFGGMLDVGSGMFKGVGEMDYGKIWKEALLDPFISKVCPNTLPKRIIECLMPSDCKEIIKWIGLWRTRDMVENFANLDVFDDRNGIMAALEQWDEAVSEGYNFKAVSFNGDGLLKSGDFDPKDLYTNGPDKFSVSLLVRTTTMANIANGIPNQREVNAGYTKFIFSHEDTFAIKKTSKGNISVVLKSADGKTAEYSSSGEADIFDGKFHQIGFSWVGSIGELVLIIDGREVKTKLIRGSRIRGPLAVKDPGSKIIVASEKATKSSKGFAGQIDEICIFPYVLPNEDWRTLAKIESDKNLNSYGLSVKASAWWRMGDSVGDRLSTGAIDDVEGQIIDRISSIDLTPLSVTSNNPSTFTSSSEPSPAKSVAAMKNSDQFIIVARLFKLADEDKFIDILNRNVDLAKLCAMIVKFINDLVEFGMDPEATIEDIKNMFKMPKFAKDPYLNVGMFIEKTVITNLIKTLSDFLLDMLEEYILNCQNWKQLLQGLTKGALAGGDVGAAWNDAFGDAMGDNSLLKLLRGEAGDDLMKDLYNFTEESMEFVKSSVKVTGAGGVAGAPGTPVTLNLGDVVWSEEAFAAEETYAYPGGPGEPDLQLSIQDTSTSLLDRNTTIEIIRKTTDTLEPDESLQLLGGTASDAVIGKVKDIVRDNFTKSSSTVNINTIPTIFGSFGEALGARAAINQLTQMADILSANFPVSDDPCPPGKNFRDVYGQGLSPMAAAKAKALAQRIFDFSENSTSPNACPTPTPLSDFEKRALSKTISDVFSSVLLAYDSDLLLYRLGLTSVDEKTRQIKKVFWKEEKIHRDVYDNASNKMVSKVIEIEETQINPEFRTVVDQGFVPTNFLGQIDGTKAGGVVETDWFAWGWPEKRPPRSVQEDEDVRNLGPGKALGPYTDYTEEYATVAEPVVKLGGESTKALEKANLNFSMSDDLSGDSAAYFADRTNTTSNRGYKNILSKSKTSLLSAPTHLQGIATLLEDSYSTITHGTRYGSALDGKKSVKFEKKGADPFSFDASIDFSLSADLRKKIADAGYDEGANAECDDDLPDNLKYTPQENVFEFVVNQTSPNLQLSPEDLKTTVYDNIYREALTAMLFKVSDSPLLKTVPGTNDGHGGELVGLNFIKINTTPRLIDMESFSEQVSEDYSTLLSCPDKLDEAPLYKALKTSVPRILARIYLVDLILRGIIPFSQLFFSKKDAVIKEFIIKNLKRDMGLFLTGDNPNGVKAKIVQQFNYLADTGHIDESSLDEESFRSNWEDAMGYFLEDEFDFVANRIKEVVHGKCIDKQDSSADGVNKNMYDDIIRYAKVESANLNVKNYMVTKPTKRFPNGEKIENYFINKNNEDDIDRIGISLSYSYNDQEVILSLIEEDWESVKENLDINLDGTACEDRALYPSSGVTTEGDGHYHQYEIDENGNGRTTSTQGSGPPHTHGIFNYTVVPLTGPDENVKHVHALAKNPDKSDVSGATIKFQIQGHMEKALVADDNFKIMFDYCFDLRDVSSLVLIYTLLVAENQLMSRAFNGTKKAILDMFVWLWKDGPSADPCNTDVTSSKSPDFGALLPDLGNFMNNPQALLMFILAPLLTFRGWTKTFDPHVFITTSIMDVMNMPINPIWRWENVPDPLNDFELKCIEVPTWPGTRLIDDLTLPNSPENPIGTHFVLNGITVEGGVATLVTFAPCAFGSPPFPPTPFGFWYYLLVMPLIWLIRDLPRLLDLLLEDPNGQMLLQSIGLNANGELTCDDTDEGSQESSDPVDGQDGSKCPVPKTFNDTIIDVSSSEC